jgi:hypothetical protein
MRSPRTPGAGITGARKSLGGDGVYSTEAGPAMQRHYRLALHLDHEADTTTHSRRCDIAELVAPRTAETGGEPAS